MFQLSFEARLRNAKHDESERAWRAQRKDRQSDRIRPVLGVGWRSIAKRASERVSGSSALFWPTIAAGLEICSSERTGHHGGVLLQVAIANHSQLVLEGWSLSARQSGTSCGSSKGGR